MRRWHAAPTVSALVLALALAGVARATIQAVTGDGVVATESGTAALPGDALAFALLYDDAAADLVPGDPALGLYPSGGFALVVAVPPLGVRNFVCAGSGLQLQNATQPGGFDGVVLEGMACLDDFDRPLLELFVQLSDSTQSALPDDVLRPELFDLGLYDLAGGAVQGCAAAPCDADEVDFFFTFDVVALAVPEARGVALAWAVGVGLAGCGCARRG